MAVNSAAWLPFKKARPVQIGEAPMPVPAANEVVIRVRAVAINPADNAVQTLGVVYETYPVIPGCDAAGEVVRVGADVQGLRAGDRVLASVFNGAFQRYCPAAAPFVARIPDAVAFADAVVLPLALLTAAVCLFEADMLALRLPRVEPAEATGRVVLVWGGASALGSCAIQMATAAGYEVAATASRRNFDYCRRLGARHVFDYADEGVVDQVVEALQLKSSAGVFCPIGTPGVIGTCALIADRLGGNRFVSAAYPPTVPLADEIPEGVKIGRCWHSSLYDSAAAREIFGTWLPAALARGTMTCQPAPLVVGRGLERIQDALDRLARGVSASKVVVEIP